MVEKVPVSAVTWRSTAYADSSPNDCLKDTRCTKSGSLFISLGDKFLLRNSGAPPTSESGIALLPALPRKSPSGFSTEAATVRPGATGCVQRIEAWRMKKKPEGPPKPKGSGG